MTQEYTVKHSYCQNYYVSGLLVFCRFILIEKMSGSKKLVIIIIFQIKNNVDIYISKYRFYTTVTPINQSGSIDNPVDWLDNSSKFQMFFKFSAFETFSL